MAMLRSLSNTPRVGGVLDDFFDNGFGMMPWGAFPVAPFLGDRGDELSRSQVCTWQTRVPWEGYDPPTQ